MKTTPAATSLDLEEAAAFLGLHPDTLRERVTKGEIPGAKIGKRWVFLDVDLADWMRLQAPRPAARKHYPFTQAAELIKLYTPPARLWMRRKRTGSIAPDHAGVYFLYFDSELTYIGSSCCIRERLNAHRSAGRSFTHFSCSKAPGHVLKALESVYISMLRPTQNRQFSSRQKCVTHALMRLNGFDVRR